MAADFCVENCPTASGTFPCKEMGGGGGLDREGGSDGRGTGRDA